MKIIVGTKTATEEKLKNETDDEKKPEIEESINDLEQLLEDVAGVSLAKENLKEEIGQRIADYGFDDLEDKFQFEEQSWEDYLEQANYDNFEDIKPQLLKKLTEIIVDYWLTESKKESQERVDMIESYLDNAQEEESQTAANIEVRRNALANLKNKLKSQKGSISLTVNGEAIIEDEDNENDNCSITLSLAEGSLRTAFEDTSAFDKLDGINKTETMIIYYNGEEEEEKVNRFNELKDQLVGYKNQKIVFYFDKLEAKSHKLVRIEDKEIHLDHDSYTRVEVSEGEKIPETKKNWNNISFDFTNPVLVKNWTDLSFTYEQTRDWINAGISPDEQKLVNWLIVKKGGDYAKPEWFLSNADAVKIRKEWLEYEIKKRLDKYKNPGFKSEEKFEEKGKSGHWGSDSRGKTWKEYLSKINSMEKSDENEFDYHSVRGGLLYCLAEILLPEFISRWKAKTNKVRNMSKAEILEYINQNCSPSENNYYDNVDGVIDTNQSVRTFVSNLPN